MAKGKGFDADGVLNDIDNFMFSAFDALIKVSVKRLGTEEASPVHTGYFASSWTAGYTQPRRESKEESQYNRTRVEPWGMREIGEKYGRGPYWDNLFAKNRARSAGGAPSYVQGVISPRFYYKTVLRREFDFRRTVYIGNKANYAAYALEGGKVQSFLGNELKGLVDSLFQEKRPIGRVFVGATMLEPQKRTDKVSYKDNPLL